jgi:hypothetical protein
MTLRSHVIYETKITDFKDISPESVLDMLNDVKRDIGKIDESFSHFSLTDVLKVIEFGSHYINGDIEICIDLSSADGIIKTYRRYSEGGCQSCVNLSREIIDAQDGSSGTYCGLEDPDYDKDSIHLPHVKYEGFSSKVDKYYQNPCESWKPRFSPILEEIIKR